MSLASATSPSDFDTGDWTSEGSPRLADQFFNVGNFLRGFKVRMRFGEFSRAPLRLLCLNVLDEAVKCDWVARPPDPWDVDVSQSLRRRHSSLQTLKDAIDVRALLFYTLPHVETADFRVYRESPIHEREMIIMGCAQRNDNSSRDVHSLVMRAKVLGFRFHLEADTLREISTDEELA
jgi:hypothetical protein